MPGIHAEFLMVSRQQTLTIAILLSWALALAVIAHLAWLAGPNYCEDATRGAPAVMWNLTLPVAFRVGMDNDSQCPQTVEVSLNDERRTLAVSRVRRGSWTGPAGQSNQGYCESRVGVSAWRIQAVVHSRDGSRWYLCADGRRSFGLLNGILGAIVAAILATRLFRQTES